MQTGFLLHAQTFIGVLISILALCILMENKDSSNILKRLIEYAIQRRENKIEVTLQRYTRPIDVRVIENKKNKKNYGIYRCILKRYVEKLKKGEISPKPGQRSQALILDGLVSVEQLNVVIIGDNEKDQVKELTDKLNSHSLPGLASFYCMLYGLFLFVCDEVIILFGNCFHGLITDITISLISSMTILSCVFWIAVWRSFNNRLCLHLENDHIHKHRKNKLWDWVVAPEDAYSIQVILGLFLIFFVTAITIAAFIPNVTAQQCVVYFVGIIIPILLFGSIMLRFSEKVRQYSHEGMFWHFIGFLVLSCIWIATFFLLDLFPDGRYHLTMRYSVTFTKGLLFVSELFILLNGLIAAYVLPVIVVNRIPATIEHYVKKVTNNKLKKHRQLNEQVCKWIDDNFKDDDIANIL